MEHQRLRLRQQCYDDLIHLRGDPLVSERAYRLLEKLVARLDRMETGSFSSVEQPTVPHQESVSDAPPTTVVAPPSLPGTHPIARVRKESWSSLKVIEELEAGKKKKDEP